MRRREGRTWEVGRGVIQLFGDPRCRSVQISAVFEHRVSTRQLFAQWLSSAPVWKLPTDTASPHTWIGVLTAA